MVKNLQISINLRTFAIKNSSKHEKNHYHTDYDANISHAN